LIGRYVPLVVSRLQTYLRYRTALAMTAVAGLIGISLQVYLWRAVSGGSAGGRVAGFDGTELTTYVLAAQLLALVHRNRVDEEIAEDIYTGSIVAALVRPVGYPASRFAAALPVVGVNALFVAGPLLVVFVALVPLRAPTPAHLLLFLGGVALSVVIAFAVNLLTGFAAVLTRNSWGLRNAKGGLVAFLSGQVIPIGLMPAALASVCEALPFQGMVSAPVRLLLGRYAGPAELAGILARQLFWAVALLGLAALVWRSVRRRLEVVGG
jgi:ABC-2 type transport system permease protein